LSATTCQILADITGRTIETVTGAQDVGAVGAALLVAVGIGELDSLDQAKNLIRVKSTFRPNPANKAVYDKNYAVFKKLYKSNAANFKTLNEI
jgi:xylulokinase